MKQIFTSDNSNAYVNALVYGAPGTGKTYSAKTLPGKTLIISIEGGLQTLRGEKMEAWEIETWNDIPQAIEVLKSQKEKLGFDNIFIDSLTEMCKRCSDHILHERVNIYEARKTNTKTMFADQNTLEDYGLIKGRMDRTVRAFRDLPYNVFFTALASETKDEKRGGVKYGPLTKPASLALDMPGFFDQVMFARTDINDEDEAVFWWETRNTESWMAKDRSDTLGGQIKPDWKTILDAYKINEVKGN